MDTNQVTWIGGSNSTPTTEVLQDNGLLVNAPAEDGVMRIGATRIGYAYILEKEDPNPSSDSELVFQYDLAGNQIYREVKEVG